MGSRFRTNQRDHLLQWLILIVLMEAILLSVPVSAWIKLAVLGSAFLTGFILRICKASPRRSGAGSYRYHDCGHCFSSDPCVCIFYQT
jgi:hypothetical protein